MCGRCSYMPSNQKPNYKTRINKQHDKNEQQTYNNNNNNVWNKNVSKYLPHSVHFLLNRLVSSKVC